MSTSVIIKDYSFVESSTGESVEYQRLAIIGLLNGEDTEVQIKLNKLDLLIAKILLGNKDTQVSFVPMIGLVIQGFINGRREKLNIQLTKSEATVVSILFADDESLSSAGADDEAVADLYQDQVGATDKINLDEE